MQYLRAEQIREPKAQIARIAPQDQPATAITSPQTLIQRASQNPHNLRATEILQLQQTIGNNAVRRLLMQNKTAGQQVQREYTVTSKPDEVLADTTAYPGRELNWHVKLAEAYAYIKELKKVLEDDSDVEEVDDWEKEVDELAKELDSLTKDFDEAPAFETTRARRNSTVSKTEKTLASTSRKRKASKPSEEERPKKALHVTNKQNISWEIDKKTKELAIKFGKFKKSYPLSEGGFSAKGRAHDMDEKETAETGHAAVTTWFKGVMLDGTTLNTLKKVYKKNKKKADPAGNPMELYDSMDDLEGELTPLKTLHAPAPFSRPPAAKPRGDGQLAAMKINATGYAKLAEVPNWENSRWEWLHIRAASLGGDTDGSNLVVGTRDANTHMMPFEANIRHLAKIVNDDPTKRYKHLKVTFAGASQHTKAKHKVEEISISWELIKNDPSDTTAKDAKGKAVFKPLQTDESISKKEVEILEKTLKEKREEISA